MKCHTDNVTSQISRIILIYRMYHVYSIKSSTDLKYIRINLLSQIILEWKPKDTTQCHEKNLNTN